MFNAYTAPIANMRTKHHVLFHWFADNMQLYVSYKIVSSHDVWWAEQCKTAAHLVHRRNKSMDAVAPTETKQQETMFIVLQSPHNLWVYGSLSLEMPGLTLKSTMDAVRNLGCYFDIHIQLDHLVSSYCSLARYHLRLITRIRHLLTRDACHAAIRCLVRSRLNTTAMV